MAQRENEKVVQESRGRGSDFLSSNTRLTQYISSSRVFVKYILIKMV